jgi:Protein of unknown function (DUF2628)
MTDFANTTLLGLYENALGQKNQSYYLEKFEDFDEQGPGLKLSWNWAAFFFTGFWALYRKMYGWFFAWWAVATVVTMYSKVQHPQGNQILGIVAGVLWVAFSIYANSLYHRKINARMVSTQKATSDATRLSKRLRARSGVLMWVPIVFGGIPIVGIVAAVALPAYHDYTKRTKNVEGVAATNAANNPASQVDWDKFVITPPNQSATPEFVPPTRTLDLSEFQTPPPKQQATQPNPFEATQAIADAAAPKSQSADEQEHLRRIYAAHPDADAIHDSAGFKAWVAKYPAYQRILSKGSTQEIIEMFTAYKNQR